MLQKTSKFKREILYSMIKIFQTTNLNFTKKRDLH